MKAGLLFQAQAAGTFGRLGGVFWKDLKKGREVKKYMKTVVAEFDVLTELRNDIVKEFGEDGSLSPEKGNWAEGSKKLEELYNQDVEFETTAPKLSDGDLVSVEGFSIFDIGIFEDLGLLEA